MKQNLQFPDGKLAVKSINEVYADSNGNVTVDHVATADAIGSTTATQVADTVNKAHTHDNKTTLDKLADASGKLTYNGSEIGGTVDESRLLPANPSDYDLAIYRVFPEEAAPQNLTSATSDPNWEVTWSGAYSDRVGWQAFDSDQSTTWCTYYAAVGDWLCWEYKGTEGSVLLRRYSIAKGSGNGDCPTGWKIQGSNDGSTWVDLDEQTGQSFPDNNAKEYTIPNNSTPYKFHRFYLLSWNTSNMIGTFKAWSWINSTEEREGWIPINKSEFVVNEARLLPTGGRNGNLLEYQEGVDRGNDVNTKLLIQPATSDGLIVDQAAGNAAPVDITNSGNVLIEDNALVFTGTNSLLIPANALGMTLGGNNEFTIDIEFQLDSVKSDYATLYGSDGGGSGYQGALYFTSGGDAHFTMDLGPSTTGWTLGTKHRITIERWNDNGTWKTSVYRNGSFLASSTSGMNTLSDYVFPIGSNNESTGRNFIGKIWAFRISNKAEHHGVSFAPQELPFLPPAGQPVWTEGIDRSRLLPEDPANGDIPCYSNEPPVGVNYNDANTVLLLQGSSDNTAAAPTSERLNGIVTGEFPVQEDGSILVNGSNNYLTIPLADTKRVFDGEFTVDTYIKTTQYNTTSRQDANWFDLTGSNATYISNHLVSSAGFYGIWPYDMVGGSDFPKTAVNGEWQHLAIDVYLVDGVRKFTLYINGVALYTGTWNYTSSSTTVACRFFGQQINGTNSYLQNASVMSLRVSNIARYKGVSFDPPADGKYLNPPAGYWGKLSKNEIVKTDSIRLLPENPSMGDIACFDATATTGGGNDANTKALLHFDAEVKDEAAGNAAPLALSSLNATIDTTVSKFGSGSLKLTSGHVFVPIPDLTAVNCVISCWVYLDSLPSSYSPLFCQDDDTTGCWNLAVDNSGIYMFCRAGTTKAKQPLQAKTWYWAAIVKSGKELRFYLNGAYIYSLTDSMLRFTNPIIGIGEQTNEDGRKFTGNVDEFRIQFLTADELSAWTGLTIPVPVEAYSAVQTIGEWGLINKTRLVNSINGITPDDTGNVTLDLLTEEQLSKLNSIVLANDFTFTQSDIVSNMITKNATTLGVPAGSMVQILSNTGIVMTERAGILVYWSGNNLIIDFTGYFNTTQTTLTGTWTVKFAGNFVSKTQASSGGASSWDEISGKPSAFPPSAHTHAQADVAGLTDIAAKAHTHANKTTLDKFGETNGKPTYDGAEIGGGSTVDESRLLPENPANGDIPCFDATATIGGGNDAHTKILLHFDADEIKDEAAGNAAPVTITKKTGTITVVEGGKWGKCAKYVTGSMTVATNLDELNANNWVVSGWFNPDENNHGVSYPTWLSMDDQNTHGFGFDSTGRYGESDGPLFYLDTPPASGTWHWLAIVKYSGGLRFYLNGAFLNEISAQQRANFCSTLAIGGFAGTHAAGSTERTFSGLVDEVRLQYIPDDEITQWTGTSIAVPDAPYSKPQTVGEWGKLNLNLSNIAAGDLLTWNGTGLTKITLAELKAKLDALT